MKEQSSCVDAVKKQVEEAKERYSTALRNLEKISSEIHLQRKLDSHLRDLLAEREDVVDGAEDDSLQNSDFDLRQTKTYGRYSMWLLLKYYIPLKSSSVYDLLVV